MTCWLCKICTQRIYANCNVVLITCFCRRLCYDLLPCWSRWTQVKGAHTWTRLTCCRQTLMRSCCWCHSTNWWVLFLQEFIIASITKDTFQILKKLSIIMTESNQAWCKSSSVTLVTKVIRKWVNHFECTFQCLLPLWRGLGHSRVLLKINVNTWTVHWNQK